MSETSKLPLLNIKKKIKLERSENKVIDPILSSEVLINLKSLKNQQNFVKISNVWTNSIRRKKFKHLSENPICVCGAGDDLQFLHDNSYVQSSNLEVAVISDKEQRRGKKSDDKSVMKVPEKLVCAEFDLIYNHGSKTVQLHDEINGTLALPHLKHHVSLPVMHPNNPSDCRKIYQSLVKLFQESGLNEIFDTNLPTSLHRLLLLVKKEQDIYNIIFHSLIKQTTIDCIERGELLANIRQRYRNILVSVPQKIKDFHDRVIAQRILDRRLTEELGRFQNIVSCLSNELNAIKTHEDNVNQMYQESKDKLKQAVEDTKNNADLLREYHSLYEMQRHRLEKSSAQLDSERDCWRGAAYTMTERVLQNNKMTIGVSLVDKERQWLRLSNYFVEILTKTDVQLLNVIKSKAAKWYEEAQKFSLALIIRDDNVSNILEKEIEKISNLREDFQEDYLTEQGQFIQPLGKDETQKLFNSISAWEKTMSNLSELFGGQSMVIEEEKLNHLKTLSLEYTDLAIEVFNRHRQESDNALYEEHSTLLELNKTIEQMMKQFYDKLTGDNGVADGIMTLQTYLENWIARLNNHISDSYFRPLPDSEWIRFKLLLDDWESLLLESKNAIGSVKPSLNETDMKKKLDVVEIIQSVENWSHRSFSGIESENLKLRETIINLQRNMIRWTAQIIIRLAPDFPSNSSEAKRGARMATISIKELQEKAEVIQGNMNKNIGYIINSTKDIVAKLVQQKIDKQSEFPDEDNVNLSLLQDCTKIWINYSQEILREMIESEYSSQMSNQEKKNFVPEINENGPTNEIANIEIEEEINVGNLIGEMLKDSLFNFENFEDEPTVELLESASIVQGIGIDSNVHSQILVQDPDLPYVGNKFKTFSKVNAPSNLPETNDAYTLIQISQYLQMSLRTNNNIVLACENENMNVELNVEKSELYLKSLEERCLKMGQEIEELQTEKSLILPHPVLLSSTNTLEHQISQSTERSSTPKSMTSTRHRAPQRHIKKKK